MEKIKLSAVSYHNTLPFVYGITRSNLLPEVELSLEVPARTASRLLEDQIDIGLVPVAAIAKLENYSIVGDFCIGGEGKVKTVCLFSQKPVDQLQTIYLDPESRTSVMLVRVLADRHWKQSLEWKPLNGKDPLSLSDDEGVVLIGDKTFPVSDRFAFGYDLSEEWMKMTGLPFVFAAWVTTHELPADFLQTFNQALAWGVEHRNESIQLVKDPIIPDEELLFYLNHCISYPLNAEKQKGMKLFFEYLSQYA